MKPGKIITEFGALCEAVRSKSKLESERKDGRFQHHYLDVRLSIEELHGIFQDEVFRYSPEPEIIPYGPEIIPYGPEDVETLKDMEIKEKDGSMPWARIGAVYPCGVDVGNEFITYAELFDKHVEYPNGEPCGKVKP